MDEPKKYIRTFGSDMEAVKKGSVPDLAPLEKSNNPPETEIPSVSNPVAGPVPSSNVGHVAASHLSVPLPVEEAIPTPKTESIPPPLPKPPPFEPLKTYAGDFRDLMKKEQASAVTVLAAEQNARTGESSVMRPPRPSFNAWYVIAGTVLLFGGIAGIYFAYTRYLSDAPPVIIVPETPAPIAVNDRVDISGSGGTLLRAIKETMDRPVVSGSVRLLKIDDQTNSVFSALQLPAPGMFLRNIIPEESMAGIIGTDGGQSLFFILSVSSFNSTFSGMLAWESTMPRDLGDLYPPFSEPTDFYRTASSTATTTVATTTSKTKTSVAILKTASSTPASVSGWKDEVVNNHDVRAYRDSYGRSIVIYGYWNQKTLIIARDPTVFSDILNRLTIAKP